MRLPARLRRHRNRPPPPQPVLPLPDKPSIAVLPFANMSGDPEREYFADGMVEEIATAFKGRPVDVKQVRVSWECVTCSKGSVRPDSGSASQGN